MIYLILSYRIEISQYIQTLLKKYNIPKFNRNLFFNDDKKINPNDVAIGSCIIYNIDEWNLYKKYSKVILILILPSHDKFICDAINIVSTNIPSKIHKIFATSEIEEFCEEYINKLPSKNSNSFIGEENILNEKKIPKNIEGFFKKITNNIHNNIDQKHLYYINIAKGVGDMHKCLRRNVGAVIVKNDTIISTGFNGAPRYMLNCVSGGCPYCKRTTGDNIAESMCICIHAEASAIHSASKNELIGSILYTTVFPCRQCVKTIIHVGIKAVYYAQKYKHTEHDDESEMIFASMGVLTRQLPE